MARQGTRFWLYPHHQRRVPHISLVFREMWDSTALAPHLPQQRGGSLGDLPFRSKTVDIDNGLCEGLRSFLRQIVANAARDEPGIILAGELIAIRCGGCVRCAVCVSVESDRGQSDVAASDRWVETDQRFSQKRVRPSPHERRGYQRKRDASRRSS